MYIKNNFKLLIKQLYLYIVSDFAFGFIVRPN